MKGKQIISGSYWSDKMIYCVHHCASEHKRDSSAGANLDSAGGEVHLAGEVIHVH